MIKKSRARHTKLDLPTKKCEHSATPYQVCYSYFNVSSYQL